MPEAEKTLSLINENNSIEILTPEKVRSIEALDKLWVWAKKYAEQFFEIVNNVSEDEEVDGRIIWNKLRNYEDPRVTLSSNKREGIKV